MKPSHNMLKAAALMAMVLLAGCTVLPTARTPEAFYDFGPLPAASAGKIDKSVLIYDALAPEWLDAPAMHYRLAQSSPAQPRTYANSRWVMSPAALLTLRLKNRLAAASKGAYSPVDGVRADLALRIELEEFAQVFDSPTTSSGQVRVRASLSAPRETPVQKTFTVERPAPTPDADGGAKALIAASDEAVRQIVEWTATGGKGR